MKNKLIAVILCVLIITPMFSVNAFAFDKGERGTFFSFLFIDESQRTQNILKPYNITSEAIASRGVKAVAKETAYYLKSMPKGRHAIDIYKISYDINNGEENVIWWDKGADELRKTMHKFFEALKAEGAELDYIIDDMEDDMSNWSIEKKEIADAIVADPRYATQIRPELESRGFRFGTAEQGDLYYVVNYTKDKSAYNIWNRAIDGDRLADYHNSVFYNVAKEYYPDIKLSNYSSVAYNGEAKLITGLGHKTYLGGPGKSYIGTHSSPVCYGTINHITWEGKAPEGYRFSRYHKTAYNAMLIDAMKTQSAYLSTEGRIMPWIGIKGWHKAGTYGNFFGTDYYQEFLFHIGLLNPDPFLVYNEGSSNTGDDMNLIENILYQLDDLCGFADRKPLVTKAVDWNRRYLLSGMYAGGKNVWRITPDLYIPGVSMQNFLVSEKEMIFQIGNEIVDFPEGSYIYTPDNKLSEYGYWVISPKGTFPEEFTCDAISPALASIETADHIPTGYMYETESVTYNPAIHSKGEKEQAKTDKKEETSSSNNANNIVNGIEIPEHWAKTYLSSAVKAGIIEGSADGLMPDKNISRAEIITMLLRAFGMEADKNAGPNWYDGPIATAKKLGWIEETDDGPTIIDRQETARIMVRAFHIGETSRRVSFTDIADVSPEMLSFVLDAASAGMINGTPDGSFKPRANITRAEAVTMIVRCMN